MSLKDLKLGLIIEALDRATAPLRHIGEGLEQVEHRTEKLHSAMHKLGLAEFIGSALFTGALVEGGHKLLELTDKVAELGENALHMGQKMGVSIEQAQRLGFAAKQLGVDQDALSATFFRFQTHLANAIAGQKETRKALQLLGISLADAKRLSKDPYEGFLRLAEGMNKIANPALRAKLALDLFSRSGYEMLPMFAAGREEIEGFGDQLDKMHAVMTTEDAKASEEFIQKKRLLGVALMGLEVQIGRRLIPSLTQFIDKLTDLVEHTKPEVFDRLSRALDRLIGMLPVLLQFFEQLVEWLGAVVPKVLALTDKVGGLKTVLTALAVLVGVQLVVAFGEMAFGIAKALVAVGEFVEFVSGMAVLATGVTTLADAFALLDIAMDANPIGLIVLAVAALVGAIAGLVALILNWGSVVKWIGGVWDGFAGAFMRLPAIVRLLFPEVEEAMFLFHNWGKIVGWVSWLWGGLQKVFVAASHALHAAWDGVVPWFEGLWKRVGDAFEQAWERIEAAMPPWLQALLKLQGLALSVAAPGLGDLGDRILNLGGFQLPDQWELPAPPGDKGQAAPGAPTARAPLPRPGTAGKGEGAAEVAKTRADVHLHVTSDGRVDVRKVSSDGGSDVSIHRGLLPA